MTLQSANVGHVEFALELGGVAVGNLQSCDGGFAAGDVITEAGHGRIQKKHLAGVHFEEISLTFGEAMDTVVFDWIASTLNGDIVRKNGAIVVTSGFQKSLYRLEFTNALITEIGFPALEASSKDRALFSLKLAPETTTFNRQPVKQAASPKFTSRSRWLASNFLLAIDGVDCSHVSAIQRLTVRQQASQDAIGQVREFSAAPTSLQVPDLVVTLAYSRAGQFYDWYESFLINGNDADAQEKSGSLQFLGPDLKTALFTLNFAHLGIFRLAPLSSPPGADATFRVMASMYCEQMTLALGNGATASQSSAQNTGNFAPPPARNPVIAVPAAVSQGFARLSPTLPLSAQPAQPPLNLRALRGSGSVSTLRFRS